MDQLDLLEKDTLLARAESLLEVQQAGTQPQPIYGLAFTQQSAPGPFQTVNQSAVNSKLSQASPDGKWTASTRKNNLYFVEAATKKERQVTNDGSDFIFNGRADAVYQEEIFFNHKSRTQAFWWSPDSKHVAFMRLDDTNVPRFSLINSTQRVQTPEITTYPKAGQPNPTIKLGVAHVGGEPTTWIDLSAYEPKDLLISRVGWSPDSKLVYFYAQNRTQTWLDLCMAPPETGKAAKLFRDQTQAWIRDNNAIGPVNFLKDGSFLFFSERSGNRHLYHYAADGKLKNAVTSGDWDTLAAQAASTRRTASSSSAAIRTPGSAANRTA